MLPSDEHRVLPARPLRVSRQFQGELLTSAAVLVSIGFGFMAVSWAVVGWRGFLLPMGALSATGTAFVAWVVWQRMALAHACARKSDEVWLRVVGPDGDAVEVEGDGEVFPEQWGAVVELDGARWMVALRSPDRAPHARVFARLLGPMFRSQLLPVGGDGSPFLLDAEHRRRLRDRLSLG